MKRERRYSKNEVADAGPSSGHGSLGIASSLVEGKVFVPSNRFYKSPIRIYWI